jgi:hypothetical protein
MIGDGRRRWRGDGRRRRRGDGRRRRRGDGRRRWRGCRSLAMGRAGKTAGGSLGPEPSQRG